MHQYYWYVFHLDICYPCVHVIVTRARLHDSQSVADFVAFLSNRHRTGINSKFLLHITSSDICPFYWIFFGDQKRTLQNFITLSDKLDQRLSTIGENIDLLSSRIDDERRLIVKGN